MNKRQTRAFIELDEAIEGDNDMTQARPPECGGATGSADLRCKKKDCRYWRDTPLGDSHAKCMTCCHSAWLPKSEKDNYKPNTEVRGGRSTSLKAIRKAEGGKYLYE